MNQKVEYRAEVLQDMRNYAKTCEHPEAPFTVIGDRELNLLEMMKEVEKRTDIGIQAYLAWGSLFDNRRAAEPVK